MRENPNVSVVMSVYNGERYLHESVDSILNQTFANFEFIIVNDGSTDDSASMLAKYQDIDGRIRLYHQENHGVAAALNRGLSLARGEYIARMDSDDICMPDRFERQLAFMEAHAEVGVLGGAARVIGQRPRVLRRPEYHEEICWYLTMGVGFFHPTVMMRKEILDKNEISYDPSLIRTQDYDLWVRIAQHTKLANLPQVLLHYRMHPSQMTRQHLATRREIVSRIRLRQLGAMDIVFTADEGELHNAILNRDFELNYQFVSAAERWLRKLNRFAHSRSRSSLKRFDALCAKSLFRVCYACTCCGFKVWSLFFRSSLSDHLALGRTQKAKFAIKCALHR